MWYAGKKRISYRGMVGIPKENRPQTTLKTYTLVRVYQNGSPGSRMGGYGICSHLEQDRIRGTALVNTIVNFRVP